MKNITLKISRKEALEFGLLTCGNCGYPENNHFDFDKRPCAHDKSCKGYKEVSKIGKILIPKKKK